MCVQACAGIVIKLLNGTLGNYSIRNGNMVATGHPYMSTFFVVSLAAVFWMSRNVPNVA